MKNRGVLLVALFLSVSGVSAHAYDCPDFIGVKKIIPNDTKSQASLRSHVCLLAYMSMVQTLEGQEKQLKEEWFSSGEENEAILRVLIKTRSDLKHYRGLVSAMTK
ncbi:MAG: hypothetical protein A2494_02045 [Candidatus Lloydbacteria bacterium RIFOXYC12_FULL_46_25]|uniref:Uncharacterized protein n=1 Tax=Candidatus Lloydbacteria bacterium RIFOXYC12_FULL_46_25 TaxID=1798670 RepID=A0A1G2E6W0_9BACT|nr:MAG: hypothetical protein A2494_02045 [Candidatus Lloydbacteria bacterium RIFOXYC12_FULL_46_25]